MVLQRIRLEIEGKRPKTIYRRLYGVIPLDKSEQRKGRWHKAWIRYNKKDIMVYLVDGEWISHGEVKV